MPISRDDITQKVNELYLAAEKVDVFLNDPTSFPVKYGLAIMSGIGGTAGVIAIGDSIQRGNYLLAFIDGLVASANFAYSFYWLHQIGTNSDTPNNKPAENGYTN